MRRHLPASVVLLAAAAVAVPSAGAQPLASGTIYVNPATGNDATCAPAQPAPAPCRTLAGAVDLAARRVVRATIILSAGVHVVDTPLTFPADGHDVVLRGLGGAQSVIRLTGAGSLASSPHGAGTRSHITALVITGDAPGAWVRAYEGTALSHIAVVRARAETTTLYLTGSSLADSVVRAVGAPPAVYALGRSGVHDVSVSGGRLAFQNDGPDGWGVANQVVASHGVAINGGSARLYNTAVSMPAVAAQPALQVGAPPQDVGQRNAPIVALSSITQNGCASAVDIAAGARDTAVMVAGSLVQWPACGTLLSRGTNPNVRGWPAVITWQSSLLHEPAGAPLAAQPVPPRTGSVQAGSRVIPAGRPGVTTGGQWPASLMPAAGSPLIDLATDAVSAEVGINFPCSLTTTGPNCRADAQRLGVMRPTGRANLMNPAPDAGAHEWSRAAGAPAAPPSADGIPMAPAGDGGEPVPAINGVDGAAQVPGAPEAGVDTGQRAVVAAAGRTAYVAVRAPGTARLGRALRVRVTVRQPSRVKIVLRRALARPTARAATRVVGTRAVRLRRAGTRWVLVPLNSGARRGQMTVGATARQPGYAPGHDLDIVRVR